MKARSILCVIALVVVPTAILSLIAGRAVRIQEQNLERRLEATADQTIEAVADSLLLSLELTHSRTAESVADIPPKSGPDEYLAMAAELRQSNPLINHVYVTRLPDTFIYPSTVLGTDPATGRRTGLHDVLPGSGVRHDAQAFFRLDDARTLHFRDTQYKEAAKEYRRIYSHLATPTIIRSKAAMGAAQCRRKLNQLQEAALDLEVAANLPPRLRDEEGWLPALSALKELTDLRRDQADIQSGQDITWTDPAITDELRLLRQIVLMYDQITPLQLDHLLGQAKDRWRTDSRFAPLNQQLLERQRNSLFTVEQRAALMDAAVRHIQQDGLPSRAVWLTTGDAVYSFGPIRPDGRTFGGFAVDPAGLKNRLHATAMGLGAPNDLVVTASVIGQSQSTPTNAVILASARLPYPFDDLILEAYPSSPQALQQSRRARLRFHAWGILLLAFGVVAGAWTVLRQASVEIRLARERSDFVAGVSHDLRTPLSSMRMLAESLYLGRVGDTDEQKEFLKTIVQESQRLGHLVERILFIVRMGERAPSFLFRETDIAILVRDTVEPFVDLRIEPDLPAIAVDPDAIVQVIRNLVDNAVKYSGGAAVARVRLTVTRGAAGGIDMSVSDEGIGMHPHELKKVFRKFYRGKTSAPDATPGIGLGLALCRHIVHAHGGRIEVASTPGLGSAFTVKLPLRSKHRRRRMSHSLSRRKGEQDL